MTFDLLSFIFGWAGCCVFMFATQTVIWFRNRRRILTRLDNKRSLTEMVCPWPLRHHEFCARPDWVAEAATRVGGNNVAGGGNVVRFHNPVSSRFLSSGSEGAL